MIFVECKPDWTLVQLLIAEFRVKIIHSGNKSGVCKRLLKNQNCIGLVDEDPMSIQPSYIENLDIEYDLNQLKIQVKIDKENKNRLILLKPTLEEWILEIANNADIDTEPFGIPSNPKKFHAVINHSLDRFRNLIEFLNTQNEQERLSILQKLLKGELLK